MRINIKKFLLALVLSFIGVIIIDILLHAVLLRDVWSQSGDYWLPAEEMNKLVPFGWLSLFIMLVFYGLIYTQLRHRTTRKGLTFGVLLGLASVCGVLGLTTVVPWPLTIVMGMALQQFVNNVMFGLIFGRLYKA